MAALQRHILDLCPVNVLRPTLPEPVGPATRKALVDIYEDALVNDLERFHSRLREVYSLGARARVKARTFKDVRALHDKAAGQRELDLPALVRLNADGCVWRTKRSLYQRLQDSFHGVDGDWRYTRSTALCATTLVTSTIISLFKVSTSPTLQFLYAVGILVLYNTYFLYSQAQGRFTAAVLLQLLTMLLFRYRNLPWRAGPKPVLASQQGLYERFASCIILLRGLFMTATIIAILAVDNIHFNRTGAKTFFSGYSLMDVGCGFMIVHSGCMAGLSRRTKSRSPLEIIKRNWALFLLGVMRLLATAALDYNVPVDEYGVHWNFFISLGVTKILAELLLSLIPDKLTPAVPLVIMPSYEIALYALDVVRTFPLIQRTNLLTANKEGIIAIPNSLSLFFIGYCFTKYCAKLYEAGRKRAVLGVVYGTGAATAAGSFALYCLGLPSSRSLVNARFVMNATCVVMSGLQAALIADLLPDETLDRTVLSSAGKQSFVFFIVANLITGAVNIATSPLLLPFDVMFTLMLLYGLACFACAVSLERRNFRLL